MHALLKRCLSESIQFTIISPWPGVICGARKFIFLFKTMNGVEIQIYNGSCFRLPTLDIFIFDPGWCLLQSKKNSQKQTERKHIPSGNFGQEGKSYLIPVALGCTGPAAQLWEQFSGQRGRLKWPVGHTNLASAVTTGCTSQKVVQYCLYLDPLKSRCQDGKRFTGGPVWRMKRRNRRREESVPNVMQGWPLQRWGKD